MSQKRLRCTDKKLTGKILQEIYTGTILQSLSTLVVLRMYPTIQTHYELLMKSQHHDTRIQFFHKFSAFSPTPSTPTPTLPNRGCCLLLYAKAEFPFKTCLCPQNGWSSVLIFFFIGKWSNKEITALVCKYSYASQHHPNSVSWRLETCEKRKKRKKQK